MRCGEKADERAQVELTESMFVARLQEILIPKGSRNAAVTQLKPNSSLQMRERKPFASSLSQCQTATSCRRQRRALPSLGQELPLAFETRLARGILQGGAAEAAFRTHRRHNHKRCLHGSAGAMPQGGRAGGGRHERSASKYDAYRTERPLLKRHVFRSRCCQQPAARASDDACEEHSRSMGNAQS